MTEAPRKPGPKRTGSVEPVRRKDGKPAFIARIRLGDGTRARVEVPAQYCTPAGGRTARERAELYAAAKQEEEDETGKLLAEKRAREAAKRGDPSKGETVDQFFDRYLPTLECGESYRRISKAVWGKWVSPVIGPKAIKTLTRDDVEDVRDKLDRAIESKEIRHSTARNTWSTLSGALKAAYNSRDRSLRVHGHREAPLHFGLLPPKRGASRQRPWLYPSEWLKLVNDERIAVELRQTYAILLYTGLRPNEARALTWGSVDLHARTISVSQAFDRATNDTKAPKTAAGQRVIPIQPNLVPLLESMHVDDAAALVVPAVFSGNEHRFAESFREQLKRAGVTRPRLSADNETEEPVDVRSLRDSYATWLAIEGVSDKIIQRRMGHASGATTDRYIKAAESLDPTTIGAPFPPLPKSIRATNRARRSRSTKSPDERSSGCRTRIETSGGNDVENWLPAQAESTRVDVSARTVVATSPLAECTDPRGNVHNATNEGALEEALRLAAVAGRWDICAALARGLEARRLEGSNVVPIHAKGHGKPGA